MSASSGILTIDLSAVRENYRILKSRVGENVKVSAVVKANAYGLGAAEIARALVPEGCDTFFVANIDEAVKLRPHCGSADIFVLNGFYPAHEDLYRQHRLIPVLGSFREIKACRDMPVALKFNTRMNRFGFGAVEAEEMFANMGMIKGLDVRYVMSHLACADEPDHEMNATQLEIFQKIAGHFPGVPKALANSSGIFLGRDYHFDMVRPGAALYGLNPVPEEKNPMRSVVSLRVPIIRTRIVYKDAVIGYGATHRFEKDSPLATVSVGYADGIFRSLSNRGKFYWNGIACPIRGRVSMDLTTVDLSAVPEAERPKPGDYLEVLGEHQGADALGADAGTIGYEILTSLSARYERRYVSEAAVPSQPARRARV